ncbi:MULTISPECIES: VOC family protein [Actinomadura]|uniref:VOC family protein n=1 Tax=Actinomadura TaxID=1988 RepID=UPI002614B776|nr:VOC family protein [Actinomadura geliboluensis]
MSPSPGIALSAPVLDAPDPHALAGFYQRLLGWTVVQEHADWVKLRPPGGGTGLSFQTEPIYRAPTWPAADGSQQIMAHLDFEVDDLEAACERAKAAGAVLADFQPEDDVRVFLDPVGHPFCLFLPEPEAPPAPA